MVKAAYSSGTPAYGVGPGNAVQLLAEDADPEDAAAKIAASKAFDNATSCSSENSVVVHQAVYDRFVDALKAKGAYLCGPAEKAAPARLDLAQGARTARRGSIPRSSPFAPRSIAAGAGIAVPPGTKILMVEAELPRASGPAPEKWAQEKISPVLTLWRCESFQAGLEAVVRHHRRLRHRAFLGHLHLTGGLHPGHG